MPGGLGRHASELWFEFRCLTDGRYPSFVTRRTPTPVDDGVPAFVFHTIEPGEFEAQLVYLADNGYRTVDCDSFHRHLLGVERLPDRSVLLTIDDGRSSIWTYGYPLLKKYGFRAVVFLIPGYTVPGDGLPRNLDDVWAGRCDLADLRSSDPELLTWAQIEAMHAGGTIDFQSHSLYHHRVPIGSQVVDFLHPGNTRILFDVVVPPGMEPMLLERGVEAFYGLPVYENDSLMAGRPGYRPDERLDRACLEHVAERGGAAFFRSSGWRKELMGVIRNGKVARDEDKQRGGAAFGDGAAARRAILDSMERSRRAIEDRLPGKQVRHFCYPNTIGSDLAVALSREAGYRTNFWGVLTERSGNRPGDDPFRCPRLKGDYVFRLPGRSRRRLTTILASKFTRRLSYRPVY